MNIELRHFRYFIAVAEELHFHRAAERLHISQPPLSQNIKQLETELGVKLFERSSRAVVLTDAGKRFLQGARLTLREAENAVHDAQRAASGTIGRLSIGYSDDFLYALLPELLIRYQKSFPAVRVESFLGVTFELTESVASGRLDIVFGCPPFPAHAKFLASRKLPEDRVLAILPVDHRLANEDQIDLAELVDDDFVYYPSSPESGFVTHLSRLFYDAGFTPNVRTQSYSTHMVLNLVTAGIGVAVASAGALPPSRDGVAYIPLTNASAVIERAVVWRSDHNSQVLNRFLEQIDLLVSSDADND